VHIDLYDYSLYEPHSVNLYRGTAKGIVHVVKMDESRQDGTVIYSTGLKSVYPGDAPVSQTSVALDEFRRQFLSVLSAEIGNRFYRPRME